MAFERVGGLEDLWEICLLAICSLLGDELVLALAESGSESEANVYSPRLNARHSQSAGHKALCR